MARHVASAVPAARGAEAARGDAREARSLVPVGQEAAAGSTVTGVPNSTAVPLATS
jgi:hypothetical protein